MADVVRVGIVGCGKISEADHIPGYLAAKGCKITALCDPLPERRSAVRKMFPELKAAEGFDVDEALFASGLVDAVTVCTPNDLHHPQTVAACKAGLHVLCEKPMAGTLEQTTEMIEAAKEAGVILHINQSVRYNGMYQRVVKLVQKGAIGEPFHIRCIRGHYGTPNVTWSPGADWFVQKEHEGGLLVDIGIHMADMMRMIMGPADTVAGFVDTRLPDIDVSDNVNALFRYKSGATGVLELSWTMPGDAGYLEVYGTKGRIRMGFSKKGVELWKDGVKGKKATSYPKAKKHDGSQVYFIDAIRGKRPTLTPGEYGRRAMALCLAVQESSDKGTLVKVKHFDGDDDI
jgi:predicted dehydrogenase